MVIQCPGCNARVEVKAGAQTARCEYCGAPLSLPSSPQSGDPIGDAMGKMFEDKDGDGVPDLFQAMASGGGGQSVRHVSMQQSTRYVVNGKEYRTIEEMPPDVRRIFESTQGMIAGAVRSAGSPMASSPSTGQSSSATGPGRTTMILIVAVVVLLAAAGALVTLLLARS